MTHPQPQTAELSHARRFDWRTINILLIAALIGAAWAAYSFASTGGARGEDQLRPLVWTIFAVPFALFLGWVVARRSEVGLAAFVCFCVYFYTPFVAARIESLVLTPAEAAATKHALYFQAAMVLHIISAVIIAVWRGRSDASSVTRDG